MSKINDGGGAIWWDEVESKRDSPSGGSHRSQDSGFSDSETSQSGTQSMLTVVEAKSISRQQQLRRARSEWECPPKEDTGTIRRCSSAECLPTVETNPNPLEEKDDETTSAGKCIGSCSDLDSLPPPIYASTPKSTKQRTRPPIFFERLDPVDVWLDEARTRYEPECMNMLQTKSLLSDVCQRVSILTNMSTTTVKSLHHKTKVIFSEIDKINRFMSCGKYVELEELVKNLVQHMTEVINEFSTVEADLQRNHNGLETASTVLIIATKRSQLPSMKTALRTLTNAFAQRIDQMFLHQIKRLVDLLEETQCYRSLLSVLSGLNSLSLPAAHLGDLLARSGGVIQLLFLCVHSSSIPVRSAALRMLATVCCTPSSIMQFERGGGIEVLSDILGDEKRGEVEHCEAASVLAQVTAPWTDHGHIAQNLGEHLPSLVGSLTRVVNKEPSWELLLICGAALANLSWAEPRSVWPLVQFSSVGSLLTAIRKQGPKACVFLREQAATLLANMSAEPEVRPHIVQHRAVPALLCFLQVSHSPLQTTAEIAAAYRVQHKSAIALSRLCSEPEVANQVVQLQGVLCLTRLCKEESERNNNNGVLIACLGTLRKIAEFCGREVIDDLNRQELVEPNLLDSFLRYSSGSDNEF